MTAPERRRPLPALVFIGALSLLTALVWFRVLHRTDSTPQAGSSTTACPSPSHSPSASSSAPPAPPTTLPVPAKVTVLVLNSTNRNGVAGAATKLLQQGRLRDEEGHQRPAGLRRARAAQGVGEIRYAAAQLPSATLLSYYFPRATLVVDKSAGQDDLRRAGPEVQARRPGQDGAQGTQARPGDPQAPPRAGQGAQDRQADLQLVPELQ